MSLATRCTSCQTAFRVVQDQLKISEGWVRCGRCDAVFNALEELFDLGSEEARGMSTLGTAAAPPAAVAPQGQPSTVAAAPSATAADGSGAAAAVARPQAPPPIVEPGAGRPIGDEAVPVASTPGDLDALLADPFDAHLFRKRRHETAAAVHVRDRDRLDFSDARFDSDLFADPQAQEDPTLIEAATTDAADLPLESAAAQQPDFLRRADRRARWRSRPMRIVLSLVVVLGLGALALQAGHHHRDRLAARSPALRPALQTWCRAIGCRIEAPRDVDAVTVESTALTRAIGRDGYVLAVTLQSRAGHALSLPWVDLALTDANGRLVARRALSPADFGVAPVIEGGREAALQLALDAGDTRVAGYTVEIFYP